MTTRNTVDASGRRHGAVATPHALATEAATEAIRDGGNAIDAALAAAFVLTVVYPHNTALGGDLIALIRQPDGTITCVNSSGPASRNVDAADFRRRYGDTMPVTGVDTITVPGAVAGLKALHDFGAAREWSKHLTRAIELASSGAPVAPSLGVAIKEQLALVLGDPGLVALLAPGGDPLLAGEILVQPALARSLRTLAELGPSSLYGGELGRTLVAALAAMGGRLDNEDFAQFTPRLEEPLRRSFGSFAVWTSAPNSQGLLLLEILGALEALGPERDPLGRDAGVLSELFRLASIDRDESLADPDSMKFSSAEMLESARLERLAHDALQRTEIPATPHSLGSSRPKGDTVAVVTADSEGRAVCLIQSVFHSFGAAILEPETGIVMHNRGSFFSLSPDSANQLAPGRRPAHTLMPVMVTRGENLAWVLGTMGGKAQPQILTQVLLRLFAGESPLDAVTMPRWVIGGLEVDQVNELAYIESTVPVSARESIQARLSVVDLPSHDEITGHAQVIAALEDDTFVAASDPRSDGRGETAGAAGIGLTPPL
ncbi:MAG TPA: gamma-glutamyltransferase [Acidimicrobiales bacterium]|nr:gamma-glutamyltransferase [Acidimicrobiales bacterium]